MTYVKISVLSWEKCERNNRRNYRERKKKKIWYFCYISHKNVLIVSRCKDCFFIYDKRIYRCNKFLNFIVTRNTCFKLPDTCVKAYNLCFITSIVWNITKLLSSLVKSIILFWMKQTWCCLTHLPCNLPCKKLIELMNIFTLIFKHYNMKDS